MKTKEKKSSFYPWLLYSDFSAILAGFQFILLLQI